MLRRLVYGSCFYLLLSMPAVAEPPYVAVDIAPVHTLVASVMKSVGEPDLIVKPGASPHSYSLSPSEAEALQNADVVFWISEKLTPWLQSSLENLAGSANKVELLETEGSTLHEFREGATFEAHEHDDDEHEQEEHAKEEKDHTDDNSDEYKEEEIHHGEHDPHAWLDP